MSSVRLSVLMGPYRQHTLLVRHKVKQQEQTIGGENKRLKLREQGQTSFFFAQHMRRPLCNATLHVTWMVDLIVVVLFKGVVRLFLPAPTPRCVTGPAQRNDECPTMRCAAHAASNSCLSAPLLKGSRRSNFHHY